MISSRFRRCFCVVILERDVLRRLLPVEQAVDLHGSRIIAPGCHGFGLRPEDIVSLVADHGLDHGDLRIMRAELPQTLQVACRYGIVALFLSRPRKTRQRFDVVRLGKKHLLPRLRCQIGKPVLFERPGFRDHFSLDR